MMHALAHQASKRQSLTLQAFTRQMFHFYVTHLTQNKPLLTELSNRLAHSRNCCCGKKFRA